MRTSLPVIACALAALLGCAEDRTPKDAFVEGANAACREYDEADAQVAYPEQLDEFKPFMREFLAIGDVLQAKLEALKPPPSDAAAIRDWLEGSERMTQVMRAAQPEIEAAVDANDQAEAERVLDEAIDEFNRISDTLDPFARSYGLFDCANPTEG